MQQVVLLLAGILMAACIFAATLFSAAQAVRQTGRLRLAHATSGALTIAAMAALSGTVRAMEAGNFPLAEILLILSAVMGGALALAALAAFALERGWNRLLPLIHLALGAALLAGLPFGR